MNTRPTIPANAEHCEAVQADVNARRAAMKAQMTPSEIARLEVIEECSAKLEAAEVPFQLWAASADGEPNNGERNGWWNFHRLSYASKEDPKTFYDRCFEAWGSLLSQLLNFQTTMGAITIVVYHSKTGQPRAVHTAGQCQYLPPPLPPPKDTVPTS